MTRKKILFTFQTHTRQGVRSSATIGRYSTQNVSIGNTLPGSDRFTGASELFPKETTFRKLIDIEELTLTMCFPRKHMRAKPEQIGLASSTYEQQDKLKCTREEDHQVRTKRYQQVYEKRVGAWLKTQRTTYTNSRVRNVNETSTA